MKSSITNISKIYFRDLKAIFKNPISILIISGLCIIPSLYSFLNIIACWNAYTNTSHIKIAVINNDKDTLILGQNVNVGNSIVDELKQNKQIDWLFVNEKQGDIGLSSGEYYAELIIPNNFSKDLSSFTTTTPIKPELIYRVNTKSGPVANKITEVAQQNLIAQINSSVIQAVSREIFTKANPYGEKLEKNKLQIIELKNFIIDLNNNMNTILSDLNIVNTDSTNISSYIDTTKNILPLIDQSLSEVSTSLNSIENLKEGVVSTLNDTINGTLFILNESNNNFSNLKNMLNNTNLALKNSNFKVLTNDTLKDLKNNLNNIDYLVTTLSKNTSLKNSINNNLNLLDTLQNTLDKLNSFNDTSKYNINQLIANIISSLTITIEELNQFKNNLNSINNNMFSLNNSAISLLGDLQNINLKINDLLNNIDNSANSAKTTSITLYNYLSEYKSSIANLAENLNSLTNDNLSQIISLLQGNPNIMSNYLQSPFIFNQKELYKIDNYGSGMTPIYSVLAFWVGILLLTSLLKTEPSYFKGIEEISIRERYFGKMLIFITLGIIQSLIIALGSKYLLKVQITSFSLFISTCILTSITFTVIIFTIVSMFRTIGKSIVIILMIIQLSGIGGTYPIQALPLFFQIIAPYLPFPYSVNLLREAVAGPYIPSVIKNIRTLLIFIIIFLLIGYFFKKITLGFFNKFESKFHKSGLAEE